MKKNKILVFLILQILTAFFSLSGVASKIASNYLFLSKEFIISFFIELTILAIYAILWQQVLKRIDISIAYANKATGLLWSMAFSYFVFKENISINNILACIVIIAGVIMVTTNE